MTCYPGLTKKQHWWLSATSSEAISNSHSVTLSWLYTISCTQSFCSFSRKVITLRHKNKEAYRDGSQQREYYHYSSENDRHDYRIVHLTWPRNRLLTQNMSHSREQTVCTKWALKQQGRSTQRTAKEQHKTENMPTPRAPQTKGAENIFAPPLALGLTNAHISDLFRLPLSCPPSYINYCPQRAPISMQHRTCQSRHSHCVNRTRNTQQHANQCTRAWTAVTSKSAVYRLVTDHNASSIDHSFTHEHTTQLCCR